MVHKYKPVEAAECLSTRRVLFVGDSTIRQVFWATAKKLDEKVDTEVSDQHTDIARTVGGVQLEFVWDPFLNGSLVRSQFDKFANVKDVPQAADRPAIILAGTGLWYARNTPINVLKEWKDNIGDVVKHMPTELTTTDMTARDLALLAPVMVPVYDRLNEDRKKTITPGKIADMNAYLRQLSTVQGVAVPFSFMEQTEHFPQTSESSGIHVEASVAAIQADILLNLRCNGQLPPKYPYTKTCCNKYEPPNWQQWSGLVFVLMVLPIISYIRGQHEAKGTKPPAWLPSESATHALLVFGLAVVYCFYADRTQVFNKSHKHYSTFTFSALSLAVLALGYFTTTKSSTTATDQPFLFRDQTDEWKGWMQFAILIYHYTGASRIAWIYGFIRITVASYLFMTGYGHTIFFIKKGDYSLKRCAGVLIRLNLLSCTLPYLLKTEYIFYYFAPLVSFWYMVIYTTMRVGAKYNSNLRFLIGKILASAAIVTAIVMIPGILEALFALPAVLANTQWNVAEWRFRVFLDMWIVYIGMLTALAYLHLPTPSPQLTRYTILTAATALPLFFLFQWTRETKFVYNAYHPYLSFIPILSFIILRNATPSFRNTYSSAYAWLGRCSLETFTLQFHIWMAADTHGLLDLGIFGSYGRLANFCVATVLFFGVSNAVAKATGTLTGWIMGAGEAKMPVMEADKVVEQQGWAQKLGGLGGRCAALIAWMWVLNLTYTE